MATNLEGCGISHDGVTAFITDLHNVGKVYEKVRPLSGGELEATPPAPPLGPSAAAGSKVPLLQAVWSQPHLLPGRLSL